MPSIVPSERAGVVATSNRFGVVVRSWRTPEPGEQPPSTFVTTVAGERAYTVNGEAVVVRLYLGTSAASGSVSSSELQGTI